MKTLVVIYHKENKSDIQVPYKVLDDLADVMEMQREEFAAWSEKWKSWYDHSCYIKSVNEGPLLSKLKHLGYLDNAPARVLGDIQNLMTIEWCKTVTAETLLGILEPLYPNIGRPNLREWANKVIYSFKAVDWDKAAQPIPYDEEPAFPKVTNLGSFFDWFSAMKDYQKYASDEYAPPVEPKLDGLHPIFYEMRGCHTWALVEPTFYTYKP